MKAVLIATFACGLLAAGGCSKDPATPASTPSTAAANAAAPEEKPPPPTDVNIALADMGGAVEEQTESYGPGFMGRRLVDGLLAPAWIIDTRMKAAQFALTWPQDVVLSFFEREPAEIDALTIVLPDPATHAPKDIEIWTSMTSPSENFTRRATATLVAKPGETTLEFDAVEAKFVKLTMLSGHEPRVVELAEIRVREANRKGYTPLFVRAPMVKHWKGSPREGAQRGLDWLQHAAPTWPDGKGLCFGCHVQSQALMGQAVALKQDYRVNLRSVRKLDEQIRSQNSWGSWWSPPHSATAFGAMGIAYAADILGNKSDKGLPGSHPYSKGLLLESADRLVERQEKDGAAPVDEVHPPIVQGQFMTTANALVSLKRAAANSDDPRYEQAAVRAVAWIASHEPQTTQDQIFKVIALMHYGTPDQKRIAWSVVETLASEQQQDGGWKENSKSVGSNAFATGQVLYAFKQAGISIHGEMFRRGVDFLLGHQEQDPASLDNGSWKAMNTDSKQPSGFAHTMWAVIGLAGAYGQEPSGALRIVKQEGDKPPARNLTIVLDVSGSMNAKLGDTTRWKTALGVLEEVVTALPEDLNVGLRVYGHRHSSKSAQTCKDSELVVPVDKLDRQRIVKAAKRLKPRGETPLIYSILQAVGDLKTAGGGSVVLITDGEESCKGDSKAAAAEIQASGVDVTLNIVGFTITGETVVNELGTLANSTGGRYYSAQDGSQLSRAVMLAALHRLPYDILNGSGAIVASGQTSELSRELPPGKYRIRIDALGQQLEESLSIAPNETTAISLGVEDDRFVLRR